MQKAPKKPRSLGINEELAFTPAGGTILNSESAGNKSVAPSNGTHSGFNDPAFAKNKTLPLHRWVPWIAGFSKDFVDDTISRYMSRPGTILDPFAGVGTTLVEGLLRGHDVIGFEINPYAALACRVKTSVEDIDLPCFIELVDEFRSFCADKALTDYTPKSKVPAGFKTRVEFYSPKVLRKVLIAWDFINTIREPTLQDLFRLAFASTMVRYSNYSYEPSLARRTSSGKQAIVDYSVFDALSEKLDVMAQDIKWVQNQALPARRSAKVIQDSFFKHTNYLQPNSVDLVITSPPYLNNYHYNRNTRPQVYWLGYAQGPQDMKHLEISNFGKYWQTVREGEPLSLDFSLPKSELEATLRRLSRLNRDKGTYGGQGWANYATSYFNDCHKLATGLNTLLKPGATALVVIGNSILQGVQLQTDQHFAEIAESVGLKVIGIDVPRATRVGSSIIQSDVRVRKAKKSHQLYEAVVVLTKS